jgi:hypothetical protein
VQQVQSIPTENNPFIEIRYSTARRQATPRYHPYDEELLERKLKSLSRRHIEATVINLLTNEQVGAVEPGSSQRWWYWPDGMAAQPQPTRTKKIVCSYS